MIRFRKLVTTCLALTLASASILGWHVFTAQGVTYTWDNGGGDGLWSTCTNWTSNTCPGASDIAQFDPGISDTSSTIDAGFAGSVAGIDMMSGFTGTITQARTLTVGSSGFVLTAGTFTGASQTIDINGPLTLTAGTFTSTSGSLTLSGALTVGSGNTFTHNSGTFTFDGAGDRTIDVDTSETFNAVTINMTSASDDVVITSGDTLIATGTLTLTNGQISTGTLEAQGATITKATTWDGGTGILAITQNTVRNITWTSGPISGLTLNAPSTTITINASSVFTYEGDLTVTSGTITHAGSTSNTIFQGTFLVNGGTYVATPELTSFGISLDRNWSVTSGTFTHSNGTVWLAVSAGDLTVQGSTTFYDLVMSSTSNDYSITLPAGQTQTIEHLGWFLASNAAYPETVRILIESSSSGSQASIDIQNKAAFASVSLKDIENIGVTTACAAQCNDRGNNEGLDFSGSIGVIVSDPVGTTSENATTTSFSVVLYSRPQSDVTMSITSTDTSEGTVSPSSLTFTNANWSTPQTVTVTGVDDVTSDGAISYTVTVGGTTSSDANYSGLDPDDVTVTNTDNDSTTAAIEFENINDFTVEDVKDSTGTPITFYSHFYGGQGTLMTTNGGAVVDISNSRIKAGCIVRVSGVDYNLIKVTDEPTYGYNVTMSRADLNLNDLEAELSVADGTVSSIRCLELAGDTVKLNDAYIISESPALAGGWVTHDSTNNKFWTPSWLGFDTLFSYDTDTEATGSFTTGDSPKYPAYESENDRIWVSNSVGDSVTAYDAVDGDYAFGGTLGASTFTVGDEPLVLEFDAENNAIWVSHSGTNEDTVVKLSSVDGSTLGTYSVGGRSYGIARDTLRDRIWVVTYCVTGGMCVVVLDATTGAYVNGTLANSTFPVPYTAVDTMIEYDPTNDAMWVLDEVPSTTKGFIYRIDAATFTPETSALTGAGGIELIYKTATDEIWTANSNVQSWSAVNAATGREIREYQTHDCPYGLALDSAGDIWGTDCAENTLDHMVAGGVSSGHYYSITSTDNGQIDVSSATSIDSATVTQTLNSQTAHYTISFDDRQTFSVFTSGAQRHIASNKNTVHSGTEGVWYYRDNASVWTAAPSNDPEEAISLAILNGSTNNRMTGSALAALSSANWVTLGFDSATTTTLDLAATLFTSEVSATPLIQNVIFTLGTTSSSSGGGGTTPIYTDDESITAPACTDTRDISLSLAGLRIDEYILSESSLLIGGTWESFSPDSSELDSMTVPFTLSANDGPKTIYVKFRSSTGNQSNTLNTSVELDQTTNCNNASSEDDDSPTDEGIDTNEPITTDGDAPVSTTLTGCEGLSMTPITDEERATYLLGISPESGSFFPADHIHPGDFIRSENFDTVYCITDALERRAFMDETTFFTQTRTFSPVKWVADETLTVFPLTHPMLPRQGVTFLKFESDSNIYYFTQDPLDPAHGILNWVTTEELAKLIAGDSWSDYVIDLNPTLIDRFDMAAPFISIDDILANEINVTNFRARQLLNEAAADTNSPVISNSFRAQFWPLVSSVKYFLAESVRQLDRTLSRNP